MRPHNILVKWGKRAKGIRWTKKKRMETFTSQDLYALSNKESGCSYVWKWSSGSYQNTRWTNVGGSNPVTTTLRCRFPFFEICSLIILWLNGMWIKNRFCNNNPPDDGVGKTNLMVSVLNFGIHPAASHQLAVHQLVREAYLHPFWMR